MEVGVDRDDVDVSNTWAGRFRFDQQHRRRLFQSALTVSAGETRRFALQNDRFQQLKRFQGLVHSEIRNADVQHEVL